MRRSGTAFLFYFIFYYTALPVGAVPHVRHYIQAISFVTIMAAPQVLLSLHVPRAHKCEAETACLWLVVVIVGLNVFDRSLKPPHVMYKSEQVWECLQIHKQCADRLSHLPQLSLHVLSLGCECLA